MQQAERAVEADEAGQADELVAQRVQRAEKEAACAVVVRQTAVDNQAAVVEAGPCQVDMEDVLASCEAASVPQHSEDRAEAACHRAAVEDRTAGKADRTYRHEEDSRLA